MSAEIPLRTGSLFLCLASAFALAVIYSLATWQIGINPADEGFYWYGAQRVFNGEVPIRDFMSYDPGRYYIAASMMAVVGNDGIWAARAAAYLILALLCAMGVYLALGAFHGNRMARWCYSLIVTLLLIVWTYPYFRTFDFLAGMMLILAVTIFLRHRSARGWFLSGLLVGIVAVIGRNHGVYGVAGHLVALALIFLDRDSARPGCECYPSWAAGIVAGYLPMILLIFFVDGFPQAFAQSIVFLFKRGATNIGLPVPWPWLVDFDRLGVIWSAFYIAQGFFFVGLLVFPVVGFGYVTLPGRVGWPLKTDEASQAVFLASVSLSLPYVHYAFSRADIEHLAPSVLPLIFGILSLPIGSGSMRRIWAGLLLLVATLVVMADVQPPLRYWIRSEKLQAYTIGQEKILIPADEAVAMADLDRLIQEEIELGGSFLALPDFMTLHAIHHQKIAVQEIYSLFSRDSSYEAMEIDRIAKKHPTLIIISNRVLGKDESLRYSNTHPLIYQWLNTNYRRVDNANGLEIYRPR